MQPNLLPYPTVDKNDSKEEIGIERDVVNQMKKIEI